MPVNPTACTEPLTSRDVALQLLTERALNREDQRLLRLMTKRVGVALRLQRDKGVVQSDQGPGQSRFGKSVGKIRGR